MVGSAMLVIEGAKEAGSDIDEGCDGSIFGLLQLQLFSLTGLGKLSCNLCLSDSLGLGNFKMPLHYPMMQSERGVHELYQAELASMLILFVCFRLRSWSWNNLAEKSSY